MAMADKDKEDSQITLFMCGPNHGCNHVYDKEEPLLDRDRNIVGSSKVCSKCGQSAFEASLWEYY